MGNGFINFTGIVLLCVWVLSRVFEVWREWVGRQRAKDGYVRALFAEVDFNTADLDAFVAAALDLEDLRRRLEEKPFVPHVTDAKHTSIYMQNMERLSVLPDPLIRDVVEFYGTLERIREMIEGLSKESYGTISIGGRVNVIRRLYETARGCQSAGAELLLQMERDFPKLALKRKKRQG
ncbi:hypothetical protein IV417_05725 [Alphaproteobacteria bacterium KMM 3653]|uniref:Uncharacterized protein n=1 Tax=Harenicola maris TaxID=2841044 RepID=A0AAP2G381_9RHOB|nr:hypothetical protein [Harenicola maris]